MHCWWWVGGGLGIGGAGHWIGGVRWSWSLLLLFLMLLRVVVIGILNAGAGPPSGV